jgi:hypothetical protein
VIQIGGGAELHAKYELESTLRINRQRSITFRRNKNVLCYANANALRFSQSLPELS